jgi:hypothetical protein
MPNCLQRSWRAGSVGGPMDKKQRTVGASVGAAVLAGLAWFGGHAAGLWSEAKPVVSGIGHDVAPNLDNIANNPGVQGAVKQAAATFKSMRNGDEYDQIVYQAACAAVDAGIAQTSGFSGYQSSIKSHLPSEIGDGVIYDKFVSSKVNKAANLLYVNDINGRAATYYGEFCIMGRR